MIAYIVQNEFGAVEDVFVCNTDSAVGDAEFRGLQWRFRQLGYTLTKRETDPIAELGPHLKSLETGSADPV